jgi:hypothetical protein
LADAQEIARQDAANSDGVINGSGDANSSGVVNSGGNGDGLSEE